MQAVNLKEKLATFDDIYVPKIVAELNGQYVKLVKFEGAYPWHSHANEDEMFLVVEGEFDLEFRDRTVALAVGEFCVVPRGVEHRPNAKSLASVLLFEPKSVRNTGDIEHDYTIEPGELDTI